MKNSIFGVMIKNEAKILEFFRRKGSFSNQKAARLKKIQRGQKSGGIKHGENQKTRKRDFVVTYGGRYAYSRAGIGG
ncbi:MAG: hypothetical protein IIZ36_03075 [Ruminococcus sp.]|nr:hypothetical protein [Ruminococcus sp.]